jgi:Flp pilus assembly protein TadD
MPLSTLKQQIIAALQKNDFATAHAACDAAQGVGNVDIVMLRGLIFDAAGDRNQALALLHQAYDAYPDHGDAAYNYGVLLMASGRAGEAISAWSRAIECNPDNIAAWANLAKALAIQGEVRPAFGIYHRALQVHPENRDLLFGYGNLCAFENQWDEACRVFGFLAQQYPQDTDIIINAGKIYKSVGRYDEAAEFYRRALAIGDPKYLSQINFHYATLLLVQQKWTEGFAAYEARLKLAGAAKPPWNTPPWREGLPSGSHILVWNDQGLGDAIMFARFIPALLARGYRVSLFVQTPLKKLFASFAGIDAVYDALDTPKAFDAAVGFASLPHILKIDPETVNGVYLSASPVKNTPPKMGVVWAGNASHMNDKNRSMAFADIAPLLDIKNIEWHNLQLGQAVPPEYKNHLHDNTAMMNDFAATASILYTLDLIICVDTAIAHLAGAMGKTAWVALPAVNSDWRWGISGDRSFWHPSLRLFRATQAGQWADIIAAMRGELTRLYGGQA